MLNFANEEEKEKYLSEAHKASFGSGAIVKGRKQKCGCFCCLKIFDSVEADFWGEKDGKETPACPYCGIDSVLCEDNGYPITPEFLKIMQERYFGDGFDDEPQC